MKRKIISLLLVVILFSTYSCNKFLDIEPVSSATEENFWKTQSDANAATAAMYALLRKAFNYGGGISFYAYGDLASDEFSSAAIGAPFDQIIKMDWSYSVASSETGNSLLRLRRYDIFYQVIDQANRVIQNLPKMEADVFDSEDIRNYYIGEAYFIRAFTYFYMSRVWGGVPLITESVQPVDAVNHAAATEGEILAQCQADLTKALSLLEWDNIASSDFALRGNKGAAFALQAHLSAWQGDYEQVIKAADSVLNSGYYSYVSRDSTAYREMFKGQSNEAIFEVSQSENNEGTTLGIGYYTLAAPYLRSQENPRFNILPAQIDSLYDDGDKRLESIFNTEKSSDYVICRKYSNVSYTNETSNAVAIIKNNIVVFRYSDVKLLKAEALVAINKGGDAEIILNEVRDRAGLKDWDGNGELIEEIFDERARELFLEGHRFYDLIRLYKNFNVFKFPDTKMNASQFHAKKYYWPFDPGLLSTNPLLKQTPYWGTVNM
ncbi:RagB/SusD family nutrient uptake outer membrane protein [Sphingobacterium sp. LRF_L2]|uniref:RagB/SusD family nutrient uptake outer membrane protein n=1 Tax=Sphingobacterium sp. LRF_L2 TaxID=3369421 RepID=UPI003F61C3D2